MLYTPISYYLFFFILQCLVFFIDWLNGPQPEEDFNRPPVHEKEDDGDNESLGEEEEDEDEAENKETSVRKRNVRSAF
jgi:hypothetical protein